MPVMAHTVTHRAPAQVAIEIQPVQAVQNQADMPAEHLIDRDHALVRRT
jgi:hypothetical protein